MMRTKKGHILFLVTLYSKFYEAHEKEHIL
jgi:hypothetical protein